MKHYFFHTYTFASPRCRVHCVTGLFKEWLRRLPEPLLPSACRPYAEFNAIREARVVQESADTSAAEEGKQEDGENNPSEGVNEDVEAICDLLEAGERAVIEASLGALHTAHKGSSVELLRRHVRVLSTAQARCVLHTCWTTCKFY